MERAYAAISNAKMETANILIDLVAGIAGLLVLFVGIVAKGSARLTRIESDHAESERVRIRDRQDFEQFKVATNHQFSIMNERVSDMSDLLGRVDENVKMINRANGQTPHEK